MHAGDIIRQRRKELGLSGRELAKLARVNQGDLSRVETGQMPPSATLAAQVCRVLGLRLAEVYSAADGATEEPPAEDMVQQIRAILIRGRWPPMVRDGVVTIVRATRPAGSGGDGSVNANIGILTGAR